MSLIESIKKTTKIFLIPKMTVNLFDFWFDYDWPYIKKELPATKSQLPQEPSHDQYARSYMIKTMIDEEIRANFIMYVLWFQIHTDSIQVQLTSRGEIHDHITSWITGRFDVKPTDSTEYALAIDNSLNQKLTTTETRVAGYLAEKLSYEQIAVRLGGRSLAAARKHAQNLAKKWDIKQTLEVLQEEAIRRGFGPLR
jgi:DNA-binding CsgD family transcriptional regulator